MPSILNIANMCSHLQNASKAKLGITSIKNTKYNLQLALAMHRAGFFSAMTRSIRPPETLEQFVSQAPETITTVNVSKMRIWLGMKYWAGKPVLSRVQMISTPKRLMTANLGQLARISRGVDYETDGGVIEGLGMNECIFIGTSQGILEAREALGRKTAGLLLCRVS